jgi:hypothetical protein
MDDDSACDSGRPEVVNISGGVTGVGMSGTDSLSRKLDSKVWRYKQPYIVCGGSSGPNSKTIWAPAVAKNAFAVGNALAQDYQAIGETNSGSSRGLVTITRADGVSIHLTSSDLKLGNIIQGDSISAIWSFRVDNSDSKTINFGVWSENGGSSTQSVTITPSK